MEQKLHQKEQQLKVYSQYTGDMMTKMAKMVWNGATAQTGANT